MSTFPAFFLLFLDAFWLSLFNVRVILFTLILFLGIGVPLLLALPSLLPSFFPLFRFLLFMMLLINFGAEPLLLILLFMLGWLTGVLAFRTEEPLKGGLTLLDFLLCLFGWHLGL